MIYRKICYFCLECKPSSIEVNLTDIFICCGTCLPKLNKKHCILCGKNNYIYGVDNVCIHCKKLLKNDIILETPIR